ncbi:MAG: excinuclease ABC subunit UvrC [Aquificae bacterium]|nr:excinuclease ABC subunit UvrC [Aquificota bacterium]
MGLQERIEKAPEKPGVYIFRRGKTCLYVGKAKNLRKRLLQHLKASREDPKERAIVEGATELEWIVTRNEYEALVLEIDLIQHYRPRYNVLHKFGGGYPLLLLTRDEYPTLKVVRGTDHEGELFGPFLQAKKAYKVKKLIHSLFKLRTCDPMPRRSEPCMDYHLGLCSGPCCGLVSREEYRLAVESARALLTGEVSEVLPKLYEKIEEFSREMLFEKCAQIRDQILALENLARGQSVANLPFKNADLFYREGTVLLLLLIRGGKLVAKETYELEREEEAEEFLLGYYYSSPAPERVFLNFSVSEALEEWLKKRGVLHIEREVPRELMGLVEENLSLPDLRAVERSFREVLNTEMPRIIEGFDISHFFGEDVVGSCVVWKRGRMSKKDYRRYRIRTVRGIDDYAALEEVLSRRARRIIKGEVEKPDAWLVDGGKGQLSVAKRVKERFGLEIRLYALAKEEEILYTEEGKEVRLKEHPTLYRVFGLIRDEAHRFALLYNRKLRERRFLEDVLSRVRGIGETKRRIIYRNFETLYDFVEAPDEELRKLGIDPSLKQAVKKYLG